MIHFLQEYRVLKTARPISISRLCILQECITCSFSTAETECVKMDDLIFDSWEDLLKLKNEPSYLKTVQIHTGDDYTV